jgi:hypothetical protein
MGLRTVQLPIRIANRRGVTDQQYLTLIAGAGPAGQAVREARDTDFARLRWTASDACTAYTRMGSGHRRPVIIRAQNLDCRRGPANITIG